jgi:prophage DNA circulation protein
MFKPEAHEAAPILQRALYALLAAVPTHGRGGSDVRTACGDLIANAEFLIERDQAGPPLLECFELAHTASVTQKQLAYVRSTVLAETPKTVGATIVKNSIVRMCLAEEALIISGMDFVSREDVDALKLDVNAAFATAEEIAADDMDAMTYRALVELHAAITFHMTETARPLPRMLRFRFAAPMPTLITAQRLYYDANRADELRKENRCVHPAFMLPSGRALSQ